MATQADKIDRIVTNRVLALPIFAAVMFLIYSIAMGTSPAGLFEGEEWGIAIGTMGTDWANDVLFGEWVPGLFDTILGTLGVAEGSWLYGLIQDGIVAGVGAVLGFVPQMLVLFLLLAILEDCGYMARIAFIMDRIFRRFGLSGNGCEFQDFEGIEIAHRRKGKRTIVFFCHPYSAYERGSNENMNRLIRRFFPKGTNFDEVTREQVEEAERWMNNYPRKLLGWKSASDLFNEEQRAA